MLFWLNVLIPLSSIPSCRLHSGMGFHNDDRAYLRMTVLVSTTTKAIHSTVEQRQQCNCENPVQLLDWPPQSLNLSLIKHLWCILKRNLVKHHCKL